MIWFLLPILLADAAAACPSVCSCKWKSGKMTAECVDQLLTSIPQDINPGTQVIDLSQNSLTSLESREFQRKGLVNLQKIFLSQCQIQKVADDAFYQLGNLVELNMTSNQLSDVPSAVFRDTSLLRRLWMGRNPIRRIVSGTFADLTYLVVLDLSFCQIEQLEPKAFRGLKNLQSLNLEGNRLTTVEDNVFNTLSLNTLFLDGSLWNCDCHLRSLLFWIADNKIPLGISPRCTSPERLRGRSWDTLAMEEYACLPVVESIGREVVAAMGDNATLECIVRAIPDAELAWERNDLNLSNFSDTLDTPKVKKYIIESGEHDGFFYNRLTITQVDVSDSGTYMCVADNRAGQTSANFTLSIVETPTLVTRLNKAQIIGVALGIFLGVVIVVVIVCIVVLRYRVLTSTDTKFSGVNILKHLASKKQEQVEVSASADKQKDLTIDKTPRQETGSSGYGSDQHTPDVQANNKVSNESNGPCYSNNKAFIYSHPVHDAVTGDTYDLHEQCYPRRPDGKYHVYSNEYSELNFDPNYAQYPPYVVDGLKSSASENDSECASVRDESYHSYNSPAHPNWKRTPLVVPNSAHFELPPDRRYSPDEGYAEEALEGTEV